MLTAINRKLVLVVVLSMLALSTNVSQAKTEPSKTYQHKGRITHVDKANRLLTIDKKTYKVVVGVTLENVPASERYSGVKTLYRGMNVFFDLKRGSEKKNIPSITKLWVYHN